MVVTFGRVGEHFLVDMTEEEESCQDAALGMAVLEGKVRDWCSAKFGPLFGACCMLSTSVGAGRSVLR